MQCQLRVGLMSKCDSGDELWMWRDAKTAGWDECTLVTCMQVLGIQTNSPRPGTSRQSRGRSAVSPEIQSAAGRRRQLGRTRKLPCEAYWAIEAALWWW